MRRCRFFVRSSFLPALGLALTLMTSGCQSATAPAPWSPASGTEQPREASLRVTGSAQRRSLSCESCTAADLAQFLGYDVTEAQVLAGLPLSDNPELGFVGSVDGPGQQLPPAGYGVYEEPIAARLRELGVPARGERGLSMDTLRHQVATGRPVMIWAISGMRTAQAVPMTDRQGRPFVAARGEHSYLVVGYDQIGLDVIDPATGRRSRVVSGRFDASWAVLGRRAVVVDAAPATGALPRQPGG